MKHLISLLLVVGLAVSVEAQVYTNQYGTRINESDLIYYKSGFLAATASDTLGYRSIAGVADFQIWGTADDSTRVLPYYRLRNSTTGALTAWTAMDTIGTDGAGTTPTAAGPLALLEMSGGSVALATLNGYNEVQFYIDYLTGCPANSDGVAAVLKVYLFCRGFGGKF